ncbi:hypothetical protein C0Z01_00415 [Photobacterium kishitanii]|uniref:hypothetical protein n=1 Tax=Photobacterium kishitanii TaxID=318456 RepID=UPI0007EF1877|nr:hypothetical protein [Photobacterium kishitanii]OBU29306.1 hypothetical protein AYY22_01960 [Photobacterium kishitanii]PSW71500.1 hypothetical protein C0Z01_00415 [Photobacterium kishitanii]
MLVGLIVAVFFIIILNIFLKKRRNKKLYNTFENWNWWLTVSDLEFIPFFYGKVIKKTDDYQFAIVGCLERNCLDDCSLNKLEIKFGPLPSLILCKCIIVDASGVSFSGIEDVDKIKNIYHKIPSEHSKCVNIIIQDGDIIILEDNKDIENFGKLWRSTDLKQVKNDDENKFKNYFIN